LVNFGSKLRTVFQKVQEKRTVGKERIRIFEKIKGELDEEMRKVKDVKKAMKETQEDLNRDREAEFNHWKLQKSKEDEDRKRKFEEEKVKAN
jgi:hypothetical protein